MFHEVSSDEGTFLVLIVVLHSPITGITSLRRFCFAHPQNTVQVADSRSNKDFSTHTNSIFSEFPESSKELQISGILIDGKETPVVCCSTDELNVFVGCVSGNIVHIQLEPLFNATSYIEYILRESGPLLSTLKGLISKQQENSICGLVSHNFNNQQFLISLSEDNKIRVWSLTPKKLLLSIPLKIEAWNHDLIEIAERNLIKRSLRIVEHGTSFKLGVFIGYSGESQIQVFDGDYLSEDNTISLQLASISFYQNDSLIDFQLSHPSSNDKDRSYMKSTLHSNDNEAIWAIWKGIREEEGNFTCKFCPINSTQMSQNNTVLERNTWNEVSLDKGSKGVEFLSDFEACVSIAGSNFDQLFLDCILQPGRFTPRMILRALTFLLKHNINFNSSEFMNESNLKRLLVSQIRAKIDSKIKSINAEWINTADNLSKDDQYSLKVSQIHHSVWRKYLELLIAVWKEEHIPIAIFNVPTPLLGSDAITILIKNGYVSFLRRSSRIEQIAAGKVESLNADEKKLFDLLKLVSHHFSGLNTTKFEKRLFHQTDPITSAMIDIETMLMSSENFHETSKDVFSSEHTSDAFSIKRSFMNNFSKITRTITRLEKTVNDLLNQICSTNNKNRLYPAILNSMDNELPNIGLIDTIDEYTSISVHQIIESSFSVLKNLLFVLLLCSKAETQLSDHITQSSLSQLLETTSEILKSYYILKWLSSKFISLESIQNSTLQISSRRKPYWSPASIEQLRNISSQRQISLLDLYIKDMNSTISAKGLANFSEIFQFVINSIIKQTNKPNNMFEDVQNIDAIQPNVAFLDVLLERNQNSSIQEIVRLSDFKDSYLIDTLAESFLNEGQYEKSMDVFIQASILFQNEMENLKAKNENFFVVSASNHLLYSRIQRQLGREPYPNESYYLYYWKSLIPEFVRRNCQFLVAKASIAALSTVCDPNDSESIISLYLNIFQSSLILEDYDQAYLAMIHISDEQQKLDALKRLVFKMIDNGKVTQLTQLPFVNLMDQVHKSVLQRAKSSEIRPFALGQSGTRSRSLYEILYAFNIAKGNYRMAAEAMFFFSDRISNELHITQDTLQLYSSALLSCITALKLLPFNSAYIVATRKPLESSSPHKRKLNEVAALNQDITQLELESDSNMDTQDHSSQNTGRIVQVIRPVDLENNLLLAQANLQLLKKDASISLAGALKSAPSTLRILLDENMFDMAYSVASRFDLKMDEIFSKHTISCLLQQHSEQLTEAARWESLRKNLDKYDSLDTNLHFHAVVVDTILQLDSRILLPIWLVDAFKNPKNQTKDAQDKSTELLSLYLKHGLYAPAAQLASEIVSKANFSLSQPTSARIQTLLPYHLIEQILLKDQKAQNPKLRSAVRDYFDAAVSKSNDILSLDDEMEV